MGSQVMEIVVWVLSFVIVSAFFGTIFLVVKGWVDGYMRAWEEQHLTNKILPGEENDGWENDPDVLDFLERADEQGPWDEQYDKSYTIGGLTADKDQGFKKFINKIEGGNSDNKNVDDEKEE